MTITARTNAFKVKCAETFAELLTRHEVTFFQKEDEFTLAGVHDGDGIPTLVFDDEIKDDVQFHVKDFIKDHIVPGSIATFVEVIDGGMTYINGTAMLITSEEIREVNLQNWVDANIRDLGFCAAQISPCYNI